MLFKEIGPFIKHLASAGPHLSNVYGVYGKDAFLGAMAYDHVYELLRATSGATPVRWAADKLSTAQLSERLFERDLWSDKSAAVIEEPAKLSAPLQRWLQQHLVGMPTSSYLLFYGEASPAKGLQQVVDRAGVVFAPTALKGKARDALCIDWLGGLLRRQHVNAPAPLLKQLLESVGYDYWALKGEAEKLALYSLEKGGLGAADVAALSQGMPERALWQLGEALLAGDRRGALTTGDILLKSGTPLLALLPTLRKQFQLLLEIATASDLEQVLAKHPQLKGYAWEMNVQKAQRYGAERLRNALQAIDVSEWSAKDSGGADELLLDRLLVAIMGGIALRYE